MQCEHTIRDFYRSTESARINATTCTLNLPYSLSRRVLGQNTRLSSSDGNFDRMLINEWKGSDGTLRKWLCTQKRR